MHQTSYSSGNDNRRTAADQNRVKLNGVRGLDVQVLGQGEG